MRRMARRGMVVALGASFAVVLATAAAMAQSTGITTHTTLATESEQLDGRAVTTYSATVVGEDGAPATGVVRLMEQGHDLASAALSSEGQAQIRFDALPGGYRALQAVYEGDATHAASQSESVSVHSNATSTSPFGLTIAVVGGSSATTMTIAAPGDSGSLIATVTPTTGSGFTGFVSLSCSGPPVTTGAPGGSALPVGVTCTFTPANLEVLAPTTANPSGAVTADMGLQTAANQETVGSLKKLPSGPHGGSGSGSPIVLAFLLPGILGLGLLGRKRKLFGRVALIVLVGALTVAGSSACNARYRYLKHGPYFTGTPPGTYTVTITAQTSDGVTASLQSQTLTLVVN